MNFLEEVSGFLRGLCVDELGFLREESGVEFNFEGQNTTFNGGMVEISDERWRGRRRKGGIGKCGNK
jgi:hypothetical protein